MTIKKMNMKQNTIEHLKTIAKLIRYWILKSTTEAGSGHPTSSLSAVELMTALLFGGFFRADLEHPEHPNNDRLIVSKGHASPLLYALYAAAGTVSERELLTLRKFGSRLEGHPSMAFPYTEAPTGSLGQGLSIGIGMAMSAKYIDHLSYKTFVLIGDSEMAEGSVWEAIQIAAHYRLDNLIGILDVNRLGERGETMYGHRLAEYEKRMKAFGWNTIVVNDGNDMSEVVEAYAMVRARVSPVRGNNVRPTMVIAKTIKGKGVSFLENKEGKHGKALLREECESAMRELGDVDRDVRGRVSSPAIRNSKCETRDNVHTRHSTFQTASNAALRASNFRVGDLVATRDAYGSALVALGVVNPDLVVLDAELSDSTRSEQFKKAFPERFFEMFIAEQNMAGVAEGLALRGKIPFVSTFAAFFTRAFDQIRMSQYAGAKITFVGSHGGVSIGQDGPSQMGLEDLAMFRSIQNSVVLYPSDAVSTESLVARSVRHHGITYLRTTREKTPVLYKPSELFTIGGSHVLRKSKNDGITVVAAGITVREALAAHEMLLKEGVAIRVVDLYSIKPVDKKTLRMCANDTGRMIVVEDHVAEGGIADAVREALSENPVPIYSLAVRNIPKSGTPDELLKFEEIDRGAIVRLVKSL